MSEEIKRPTKELLFEFDDPPGPSPQGRERGPLFGLESPVSALKKDLGQKVSSIEVGGVFSAAYTGESYSIVWFALAGVAGGLLGAIGQELWDAIKSAYKKITQPYAARRNVAEVLLEFRDWDVVLHYGSRDPSKLPDMFDDADSILQELPSAIKALSSKGIKGKTIELRLQCDGKEYHCVIYSYRRCRRFFSAQGKTPPKD